MYTLALSGSPEEPFCTLSWTLACQSMVGEKQTDAPGGRYIQDCLGCAPCFNVRNIWICFVPLDNGEKNSDYFGSLLASLPVNHKFPERQGTQGFPCQSVLCQQHVSETLRLETFVAQGAILPVLSSLLYSCYTSRVHYFILYKFLKFKHVFFWFYFAVAMESVYNTSS